MQPRPRQCCPRPVLTRARCRIWDRKPIAYMIIHYIQFHDKQMVFFVNALMSQQVYITYSRQNNEPTIYVFFAKEYSMLIVKCSIL